MLKLPLLPVALLPALLLPGLLMACTPALGAKPLLYRASAPDVLAAAAELCPSLSPGPAYRAFAVTSSNKTTLICTAKSVFASTAFTPNDPVTLRLDAAPSGAGSSVTGSEDWGGAAITDQNALNAVFAALDKQFGRIR